MSVIYKADSEIGSSMQFVKVVATTTVLSDVGSAGDTARNAVASLISAKSQPLVVGAGYTINATTTSALLFIVPATANYSTLQNDIQATALTGLAGATVTITTALVG